MHRCHVHAGEQGCIVVQCGLFSEALTHAEVGRRMQHGEEAQHAQGGLARGVAARCGTGTLTVGKA
jgi:hypothetical protein